MNTDPSVPPRTPGQAARDARKDPPAIAPAVAVALAEECRHVARRLRQEALRALGLYPVNDHAAVRPAAVRIASALAEQSGTPVALVDLDPETPESTDARDQPAPPRASPSSSASSSASSQSSPSITAEPLLRTRWLGTDQVAVLTLPDNHSRSVGVGLLEVQRLLESGREMFDHLLIDLTGLERHGEHLAAAALCDAVLLVARAGRTSEADILRARLTLPTQAIVGVLLMGAPR